MAELEKFRINPSAKEELRARGIATRQPRLTGNRQLAKVKKSVYAVIRPDTAKLKKAFKAIAHFSGEISKQIDDTIIFRIPIPDGFTVLEFRELLKSNDIRETYYGFGRIGQFGSGNGKEVKKAIARQEFRQDRKAIQLMIERIEVDRIADDKDTSGRYRITDFRSYGMKELAESNRMQDYWHFQKCAKQRRDQFREILPYVDLTEEQIARLTEKKKNQEVYHSALMGEIIKEAFANNPTEETKYLYIAWRRLRHATVMISRQKRKCIKAGFDKEIRDGKAKKSNSPVVIGVNHERSLVDHSTVPVYTMG